MFTESMKKATLRIPPPGGMFLPDLSRSGSERKVGLVRDVTEEPKRKPAPEPYTGPSREEVVAGQVSRLREPGSIIPVEEALDTAYTSGFAAGRASR